MGTGATISVLLNDGAIHLINNHWSGYPRYLGRILRDNYGTQELAKALVNLGDASLICESIECPEGHTFDTPIDGYSIFYERDRGDTHCGVRTVTKISIGVAREQTFFNYRWGGNGWYLNNVLLTKARILGYSI